MVTVRITDAVHKGRNADEDADLYKRCNRCTFISKIYRDVRGEEGSRVGWGLTYVPFDSVNETYDNASLNYEDGSEGYETDIIYNKADTEYDTGSNDITRTYDGIENSIYDPVRTMGCPQCGTLLY